MRRRRVAALTAILAVVSLVGASAAAVTGPFTGRFDVPRMGFAPATTVLRQASPEAARLDPAPLRAAERTLAAASRSDAVDGHPLFAGAIGMLVHDGMIVGTYPTGYAVRYADASGTELPRNQRVPVRDDTIFDLASVTKLFTSIAVMQLVERGKVDLTTPVATYLPEFGVNGKAGITVAQLLTHTSGLEPLLPLWQDWPDKRSRIKAVMDVAPETEPGTSYAYSDLNLIALGVLVERLNGTSLDRVVARDIARPLGMTDTGFRPPRRKLPRIAATEFQSQPSRGMVRGEVQDENAWSLGGVAGHAGVFSTARDLAVLGQALLNGGAYRGARILRPATVHAMLTNHNGEFPGDDHGLGFELNQFWYMGGLTSPATAGHTGFAGTSLVIDPRSRSIAILLTNRVHPSRSWGSINPARTALGTGLARALAVRPLHGKNAWFSGIGDSDTATLRTRRLSGVGSGATVEFSAFVSSERSDRLTVEARAGNGQWRPLTLRARGHGAPDGTVDALSGTDHRSWWCVRAALPSTKRVTLRWRFTTDGNYTARGVSVDGIRVLDDRGTVLLDGEREPGSFKAAGFYPRDR